MAIDAHFTESPELQATLFRHLAVLVESTDPWRAIAFNERALALVPSVELARITGRLARSHGGLAVAERMTRFCHGEGSSGAPTARESKDLANLQGMINLLQNGFPLPPRAGGPAFAPVADSAIYLLHNSLPFASGGYATRAHGLLQGIRSAGMSVVAYTRHGFPQDLPDHHSRARVRELANEDIIDGIPYRRLHAFNTGRNQLPIDRYIELYAQRVVNVAVAERPAVLHAASFFLNGLAAASAGRILGLPTIYEVRGLTEVTKVSRDPWWNGSDEHQMYERVETEAATAVDHVFTITRAMKEEFVRRGIAPDRITIVPNSVDADRFRPVPRDPLLEKSLGLQGEVVIGYVGSFVDYEGLDDLIAAARMLRDRGNRFKLLLVGDGVEFEKIRSIIDDFDLWDHTILTGRVPFDDAQRYYSLVDIAPLPRKPLPVTEMVSPLKPFEAMAMEKALVVSSVNALAEIVNDGETGLVFEKGKSESLTLALELLVRDGALRRRLGKNARKWVVANRSWTQTGTVVADVYRELQDRNRVAKHRPAAYSPRPVATDLFLESEVRALDRRLSELETWMTATTQRASSAGASRFKTAASRSRLSGQQAQRPLQAESENTPTVLLEHHNAHAPKPHLETWVAFEDLGARRPYEPTCGLDRFVNGAHRRFSTCPLVRGVLIDIGIPGALRREDALKLYELAYHVRGNVLELGTGYGLSASIMGEAIRASGRQATAVSIDRDKYKITAAAATLSDLGLDKVVELICKEGKAAGKKLRKKKRQFDLIFVDHSGEYREVQAACQWLPDLLSDSGYLLFHDYNEWRNRDVASDGGVFQAVQDGLSAETFEFFGVFGSCGLFRKRERSKHA